MQLELFFSQCISICVLPKLCRYCHELICCHQLLCAGRKASSKLKPQEAASSGYSAPAMPIESVDMFSGLDLSGSASHAVQPDAMPSAAEAMVDRNVR